MSADICFYSQRLHEELDLADQAKTTRERQMHAKRADNYGRQIRRTSPNNTPDVVSQWKLRRQSEVFGDWLADVL